MPNKLAKGYTCKCCKTYHEHPLYLYAHWTLEMNHTCACGAVNTILEGKVIDTERPPKKDRSCKHSSTLKKS